MNPFSHIDSGFGASIAMADFDNDGDPDLIVGTGSGGSLWYDNVGNSTFPSFELRRSKDNPLFGFGSASYSTFAGGDVDGDGDEDVWIVGGNGYAWYFENNSTRDGYKFFERNLGTSNVFNVEEFNFGTPRGFRASVDQADVDGDGDWDVVLAWSDGVVGVFRNVGKREVRVERGEKDGWQEGRLERSDSIISHTHITNKPSARRFAQRRTRSICSSATAGSSSLRL